MNKFSMGIEQEIEMLRKYNLTPNQLFLIKLWFITTEDQNPIPLKRYLESNGLDLVSELKVLQDKEIIIKGCKIPSKITSDNIYDVQFNKLFVKNLFESSVDMFEELRDHYPKTTVINGVVTGLRAVHVLVKYDDPVYEPARIYGKLIKWNKDTHKKILDIVDWANEHNIINCSLGNFIIDRKWEDLEEIRSGDSVNYNYDAIKLI